MHAWNESPLDHIDIMFSRIDKIFLAECDCLLS